MPFAPGFFGGKSELQQNRTMEERRELTLMRTVLYTFFVSGAASQPLGSFIPYLQASYGFRYNLSGVLLSCQSIGNLAAVLLTGILPAYLGRRRSILTTSIWMAAGYLIFASGVGAPAALILACLMTGIARGGNSNFSNTMMSTLTEPRATQGYNLAHGCFAIGALLSPLVLIFCTGRWPAYGWRITACGLMLLVVTQIVTYGRMALPEESSKVRGLGGVDRRFFRDKRFWLGGMMLFCYISSEYAIMGWLVTYFKDTGVLSLELAQLMSSLLWLVIFCGRMIGAAVSGKIPVRKLLLVDGIGFFACFLVVFNSRTPGTIIVGIIGIGLFMATIYTSAFSLGSAAIRGNDFGSAAMNFTGSIGGVITPALVGLVAERMGIQAGMGVVVLLTGLLLASILLSVYVTRSEC